MFRQLISIREQNGIQPNNVFVAFDEKFSEFENLIQLFNFKAVKITSSSSYVNLIAKSFNQIFKIPFIQVNFLLLDCFFAS